MKIHEDKIQNGFTLTELLVVMAILVLLLGILVPSIMKAYEAGLAGKTRATINLLAGGCEAYNTDFGEYPNSSRVFWDEYDKDFSTASYVPNADGYQLLPLWLTGYADGGSAGYMNPSTTGSLANADGKDGFGYRTAKKARPFGPYNGTEDATLADAGSYKAFQDAFDNDIYYYSVHGSTSDSDYEDRDFHDDNPGSIDPSSSSGLDLDKAMGFYILSPGPDGEYDPTADDTDDISNAD